MDLVFGWRTAILLTAIVVNLPIVVGLTRTLVNRVANRTLAALLLVLAGVVTPWAIGFAGFYGRWPSLTFFPVAMPLLVPPLAYLYAVALTSGRWPTRVNWLFVPALLHFLFMLGSFLLPLPEKQRWADLSAPIVQPVLSAALGIGFAWALLAMRRTLAAYAGALRQRRSDDASFATRWLAQAMVVLSLLFLFWAATELVDSVVPLGYDGQMPLHIGIAAVMVYLAVEGWRHAALPWAIVNDDPPLPAPALGHDWAALGGKWQEQIARDRLFIRHDLTLAEAARALGTNTSYLSRACNEGLGLSFSELVNALRSEAVAGAIEQQPRSSLLDLAFSAGFASKASFNRAFASRFGSSPSAYRRRFIS